MMYRIVFAPFQDEAEKYPRYTTYLVLSHAKKTPIQLNFIKTQSSVAQQTLIPAQITDHMPSILRDELIIYYQN